MSVPEAKYKEKHSAPSGTAPTPQLLPQRAPPGLCAIPGHSLCKDIHPHRQQADLIATMLGKPK